MKKLLLFTLVIFISFNIVLGQKVTIDSDLIIGAEEKPTGFLNDRLLFYDEVKGAFRAGGVTNASWATDSVGILSFGLGFNTTAKGPISAAFGSSTRAHGQNSMAIGSKTFARGINAFAAGESTFANTRNGAAFGRFNVGAGDDFSWDLLDPLFEVGNGATISDRNNAMTILKNGDFIVNDASLPENGVSEARTIMFFSPSSAAFRAGQVSTSGDYWSPDEIGTGSFAVNRNTIASGSYSSAFGNRTIASGDRSFAAGYFTEASGSYSSVFGNQNTVQAVAGFATGRYLETNSYASTSIGQYNINEGNLFSWIENDPVFTVGIGNSAINKENAMTILKNGDFILKQHNLPEGTATENILFYDASKSAFRTGGVIATNAWSESNLGAFSFATGLGTKASNHSSVAIGWLTEATGRQSFASGYFTSANALMSVALGRNNAGGGDEENWVPTDPLFEIGNGLDPFTRSNAMTVIKNGNVVFGPNQIPLNGSNSNEKMMFFNFDKAAFRVGLSQTKNWAPDSTGLFSIAVGNGSIAAGYASAAFGGLNKAKGNYAFSQGDRTQALESSSSAFGRYTLSRSRYGMAIGSYNVGVQSDNLAWDPDSPVFEIGIGEAENSRANAMTVLKNGNVGIGTVQPEDLLDVRGSTQIYTNSGLNSVQLKLKEVGNDFARMEFSNDVIADEYWHIAGRIRDTETGTKLNFFHSVKGDLLTLQGDGNVFIKNQLGMGVSSPAFRIDIVNSVNDSIGKARANAWTTYSDARVKSNIRKISYGLNEVMELRPVAYDHHSSTFGENGLDVLEEHSENVGFIAQEVYEIIKEVVQKPTDEEVDLWSMDYEKLTPVLVKAIQEQQSEIELLKREILEIKKLLEN